jgi:hypothetical protein
MRMIHIASLSLALLAVLSLAGSATAQDMSPALLNAFDVQQLVKRADPGDHARLSAHFAALGDRYAAEAEKHVAMSQSFGGNPNRNLAVGMSAHCARLADLNRQSAATVRELAAYHERLASGRPATAPGDAARFQGGAGAQQPTEKELKALAANASTSSDHRALQEYFVTLAKHYTTEANEHVALAQIYRGTRIAHAAVHQDHLAGLSRDAAKEATEAATMHKDLAGVAR